MGRQYSFECKECNLRLSLLEGVGKFSPSPSVNFYCPNCEKVSHTEICNFCKNVLEAEIKIERGGFVKYTQQEKNKIKLQKITCPRCGSFQTLLSFRSEWD
ncbi:MAG: hypothetical protein ACTSSG_14365 [Candidatus Heimdallarchaeaceae archaeon]